MKEIIETYFDPKGFRDGKRGCYRARLQNRHGIHAAGSTKEYTIKDLLLTAKSFDLSGEREDYSICERSNWNFHDESDLPPLNVYSDFF
jgi:hypothetical protein